MLPVIVDPDSDNVALVGIRTDQSAIEAQSILTPGLFTQRRLSRHKSSFTNVVVVTSHPSKSVLRGRTLRGLNRISLAQRVFGTVVLICVSSTDFGQLPSQGHRPE